MMRAFSLIAGLAILGFLPGSALAQGILTYDQFSSMNETAFPAGAGVIQQLAPFGQSFAPSLSGVDFVDLRPSDNDPLNGLGAILAVNIRSGSITGAVLGVSMSVPLTNGFNGVVRFQFQDVIALDPGTLYYIQPVVQSGDLWKVNLGPYNYVPGSTISQGVGLPGSDLWFREGLTPEPSSASLLLLGTVAWLCVGRQRRKKTDSVIPNPPS